MRYQKVRFGELFKQYSKTLLACFVLIWFSIAYVILKIVAKVSPQKDV